MIGRLPLQSLSWVTARVTSGEKDLFSFLLTLNVGIDFYLPLKLIPKVVEVVCMISLG